MGSFASYIPMIASTAMSMASKSSAAEDTAQAQAEAQARQNQSIYLQQAQEEQRQQNLLERALASERARMGASGLGGGGSADAIVAGMAEDTAQNILASNQAAQARANRTASRRSSGGGGRNLLDSAGNGLSIFKSFYGSGDMNAGSNDSGGSWGG